jgi:hypothetical protein
MRVYRIFLQLSSAVLILNSLFVADTYAEEMMRCNQTIIRPGDLKEQVLEQCGQPRDSEKYCAPVNIPEHQQSLGIFCTPGEKFTYTHEPSAIRTIIEFIDGKVYQIYRKP